MQLVKLKTRYASLRSLLEEEEGRDSVDAFCRPHYGLGDGCDNESKLAIALMELMFPPLTLPGLDVQDSHRRQTVECVSYLLLCEIRIDSLV